MKRLLLLFPLILASCGGGGGSSSGSTTTPVVVSGRDMTGTYTFHGYECYNAAGTTRTAVGISGDYTDTITITGNTFTSTPTTPTCAYTINQHVVFNTNSTVNATEVSGTVPAASCTMYPTITTTGGGTITTTATTITTGTGVDYTGMYAFNANTNALGFYTNMKVTGSPTDMCFTVYFKN